MRKKPLKKPQKNTRVISEPEKEKVCRHGYLGKKGYTIPKEHICSDELAHLYEELSVKPEVHGVHYGVPQDQVQFPVYRENNKKIYVPRFYGIERYGLPMRSEIQVGDSIEVDFPKPLRDYQENIVNIYMKHVDAAIVQNSEQTGGGGILEVPCGRGKTVMALKIISLLKKKTLIIVHKEFLMNQWIERANEFLPGVKIGKIQGSTFDVEGKDIVLGMLQTLYDKAFPENAFSSFGLTIVDEVHRIGSEQFSKTLLRTITPMMLGISATVDRKDKLTKVLYMFIGPKIYSEDREDDDPVCVRGLEYISSDPEFNETLYDFRGQAKYSSMITKLCEFNRRNDFIIQVLADLIEESATLDTNAQIMVLSHNKSLLKYLFEGIQHRKFATVGYYVGGMKQCDLQETEGKQIVLATYAMAAEALDIKTLSILLMATPKTDITQSVGRILRVKHKSPIVVDIVDRHEVFQNQWNQRKRFYKKCNYVIYYKDSTQYKNMICDWKNDNTWKVVYTKGQPSKEEKKCLIQNVESLFRELDEENHSIPN